MEIGNNNNSSTFIESFEIVPAGPDYHYFLDQKPPFQACQCKNPKNLCGICFWDSIWLSPPEAISQKCSKCIADTSKFKTFWKNYLDDDFKIHFKPSCHHYCFWWNFHHLQRASVIPCNVSIEYK